MNTSKVILGLTGIAAGTMLGILVAPAKGSDTRNKIFKKGGDLKNSIKETINEIPGKIPQNFEKVKENVKEDVSAFTEKAKVSTHETSKNLKPNYFNK